MDRSMVLAAPFCKPTAATAVIVVIAVVAAADGEPPVDAVVESRGTVRIIRRWSTAERLRMPLEDINGGGGSIGEVAEAQRSASSISSSRPFRSMASTAPSPVGVLGAVGREGGPVGGGGCC
jgi:hypothetical protein